VKDGDIIKVTDISDRMEERRKQGLAKSSRPPSIEDDDIENWIKDRFSQDYKSK